MKRVTYIGVLLVVIWMMGYSLKHSIIKEEDNLKRGIIYRRLESVDEILQGEFDCNAVPPLVYTKVVSLAKLPVWKRKEAFVRIVLPSVLIAEEDIMTERNRLIELVDRMKAGDTLTKDEVSYIKGLFKKYRTESFDELLLRLNTHPPSIILAQAAIESGWGSSRFFVEANNIFGVWTFKKGTGLKAIKSEARLAKYKDTLSAVKSYLYNINVGWAYGDFRQYRINESEPIKLVSYLDKYSILGEEYVQRLSELIEINDLYKYDSCQLAPLDDHKKRKSSFWEKLIKGMTQIH